MAGLQHVAPTRFFVACEELQRRSASGAAVVSFGGCLPDGAILWFGISDAAPIFLNFLASVFPITVSATAAVRNLQPVYVRAARNFGLGRFELFRRVILPATLLQILTGLRISLGVAWLVSSRQR